MSPEFLNLYQQELIHLREGAANFAKDHPDIAGKLGLSSQDVSDPYVERLLEGFAFMAARVQLKNQAQYPEFWRTLLNALLPGCLSPMPAMGVAQLSPNLKDPSLAKGVTVPAGTRLSSKQLVFSRTQVVFTTAHEVTLWPIEVRSVDYRRGCEVVPAHSSQACLVVELQVPSPLNWSMLPIDTLALHLTNHSGLAAALHDHLGFDGTYVYLGSDTADGSGQAFTCLGSWQQDGITEQQAMLPQNHLAFSGFRLMQEAIFLPSRLRFLRLNGLQKAVRKAKGSVVTLVFPLSQYFNQFDQALTGNDIGLFCSPAINLFDKRCDRVTISGAHADIAHASRVYPRDYEVHSVEKISGFLPGKLTPVQLSEIGRQALPGDSSNALAYALTREPTRFNERDRRDGWRSGYSGSDVYVALSSPTKPPWGGAKENSPNLNLPTHVQMHARCTNRDLALALRWGATEGDFNPPVGFPVKQAQLLEQPTKPYLPPQTGEHAWALIEHLNVNYLGLANEFQGRPALAMLIERLSNVGLSAHRMLTNSLLNLSTQPCFRPMMVEGRHVMLRGLMVTLRFDPKPFTHGGLYTLGLACQNLLAKYVYANSFVELQVTTEDGIVNHRFNAQMGRRQAL